MYRTFNFDFQSKGFEQTEALTGAVKIALSTRLVKKDEYAMKATRLLTGSVNAENMARILVSGATSLSGAQKHVNAITEKLANIDFMVDVVQGIWTNQNQRVYLEDESIQPERIKDAIRDAGISDIVELHTLTDVICSMLAGTGLVSLGRAMSAITVQDKPEIDMEDLEREVFLQAVETAFQDVTYRINFDSNRTTPQVIAERLSERAEAVYESLRSVEVALNDARDAIAIMRQVEEQYATNGITLDSSIVKNESLLRMMKDITIARIVREQPLAAPTCDITFYKQKLESLERVLKASPRFEFSTIKASVAHLTVDRIENTQERVTDILITAHAAPTTECVVCHHLPRTHDGKVQLLTKEVTDTESMQYYLNKVVKADVSVRTQRAAISLLGANATNKEEADKVRVHLLGNVTEDDLTALAVMNSSNIYLTGIKDAQNFAPKMIFYKSIPENSSLKVCVGQPSGRVISTKSVLAMAAYAAEQDLIEHKDYSHEGFVNEAHQNNILGNLSKYSYDDLGRQHKVSVVDTKGKTLSANLKYYGLMTNKVPFNQIYLRSPYAEVHLDHYLNALRGVYDQIKGDFGSKARTKLDLMFAQRIFNFFEEIMIDVGTSNLARSVGHDMMSKVTSRSDRAAFFHQMYAGDYYCQIAFGVVKFLLMRGHRIDSETLKWITTLFESTDYWLHNAESIVSKVEGFNSKTE